MHPKTLLKTLLVKRSLWTKVGVGLLLAIAFSLAGYSYTVASGKPGNDDLAREYRRGVDSGEATADATNEKASHKAHESGYWEGWEEGLEEGEEEGERNGALEATPEGLDFQTRYMVTYEPGPNGPRLRGFFEMPLNTLFECPDLDSCLEVVE